MSSYSKTSQNFAASGVLMPLHWLTLLRDVSSLAEIKVIGCVYGYDGIVGVEADPPTFTDLVQRTGLSKPSVSTGVQAALDRGEIFTVEDAGQVRFLPQIRGKENSLPHDHDHEYLNIDMDLNLTTTKDHDHEQKSLLRQKLYQTLLNEFGFVTSQRVAADIALTPKYQPEKIQAQIRYTRYEVEHGQDGDPKRPLRNPAGRLVYRIKRNTPAPPGFDLLQALENEGYTREQIYKAVYLGRVELPEIQDSLDYNSWLAGSGAWFDRELPDGE